MRLADVRGHDRVRAILSRALERDRVPPALLFAGPEGVGKKALALAVAQALLCERAPVPEPCGNRGLVVEISGPHVPSLEVACGTVSQLAAVGQSLLPPTLAGRDLPKCEALERSNRALQDFAFIASHDLQEPLRKIRSFGDTIAARFASNLMGDGLDYLQRMQRAASRMQTLIHSLLTYSRISTEARPFAPVDLRHAAAEALTNLEVKHSETEGRVEIGDLPRIRGDEVQMIQLFQNLLANALKFSSKGGAPRVRIFSRPGCEPGSEPGGSQNGCMVRRQDAFRRAAEKSRKKFFSTPRIHLDLTTEEMAINEFASGLWLWELLAAVEHGNQDVLARAQEMNINPELVAKRLLWVNYWSWGENLFFHADPNPDNVIVGKDSTLYFIDFSSTGTLSRTKRQALRQNLDFAWERDPQNMARATLVLLERCRPSI